MKIAIVVVCYNRLSSFKGIVETLENQADIVLPKTVEIDVVASIEHSNCKDEFEKVISQLEWAYGAVKIVKQPYKLGLKNHVLKCGDLVSDYDNIVILEEDLIVSKYLLRYIFDILDSNLMRSKDVAGASLYSYQVKECDGLPFLPQKGLSDVFLLQFPSSWGQIYSREQWLDFRSWYNNNASSFSDDFGAPYIAKWPDTSWKRHFARYMVKSNKYFIFPYWGFTTNPGQRGENHNYIYEKYLSNLYSFYDSSSINIDNVDEYLKYNVNFELLSPSSSLYSIFVKKDIKTARDFFNSYPQRSSFYINVFSRSLVNDIKKFLAKLNGMLK